jgi:5-formyltetrahydrofolate cyclo-ligase
MPPRELTAAAEQALRERAKQELRERMRGLRRVLPAEACAARSQAICARLTALAEFERARVVVGYAAYRKEANVDAALREAERRGKLTGLPRIDEAGALRLHVHREGDALEPNAYGIAEPLASAPAIALEDVDLIVVPALAVDARGHRIGYGQGYYDRLLPGLARAFAVIVAYDFQLLVETPDTPGDARAQCVITDARTLLVSAPPP